MVIEQSTNASNSRVPVAEYNVSELEVGGVVVYPDRAEVKRLIRVSLKKGENYVLINQLPSVVNSKSLRLDAMDLIIFVYVRKNISASFYYYPPINCKPHPSHLEHMGSVVGICQTIFVLFSVYGALLF